jgi:hypothetical protein
MKPEGISAMLGSSVLMAQLFQWKNLHAGIGAITAKVIAGLIWIIVIHSHGIARYLEIRATPEWVSIAAEVTLAEAIPMVSDLAIINRELLYCMPMIHGHF